MKTKLLSIFFVAAFSAAAATAPPKDEPALSSAALAGSYGYAHRFAGTTFTLGADGKYTSNAGDCTTEYAEEGTYVYADGVVVITVKSTKQWLHGEPEPDANAQPGGEKPGVEGEEKEHVMRLVPVTWGGRLYLIPEDELKGFCNAVNAGVEPRRSYDDGVYQLIYGGSYFGSFYLRNGDENKEVSGPPRLPEEWQGYLLEEPISGRVMRAGDGEAVVKVGAAKGLRAGMKLYVRKDSEQSWSGPNMWSGLEVISVEGTRVRVSAGERVAVGDKVSTKFYPPKLD